ncbi:MAG: hypothetical protein GTO41_10205 [Burkholderiales bacterium]|nr:hypothetical protein [Burkholderiales bacterium]
MQNCLSAARDAVCQFNALRIREVANVGLKRTGIVAICIGEPDLAAPKFIRQAAGEARLTAGVEHSSKALGS